MRSRSFLRLDLSSPPADAGSFTKEAGRAPSLTLRAPSESFEADAARGQDLSEPEASARELFSKSRWVWVAVAVIFSVALTSCRNEAPQAEPPAPPPATPRLQPGTEMGLYAPEQHDLYSGDFVISAGRVHQVGRLDDPPGWDHVDNQAQTVHPVEGSIDLDVNEIENTGTFVAQLKVPAGDLVIEMDRFHEFSPCQDGGIAAFIFEHGDSGCGDTNWPKSLLYVAGWGFGHATLNGEPLYEEFQIHFMVTQGMRNRDTLQANYPLLNKRSPAGAVDPAAQQLDFFIRSPEIDDRNNPNRAVFDHFFAMEVTWK